MNTRNFPLLVLTHFYMNTIRCIMIIKSSSICRWNNYRTTIEEITKEWRRQSEMTEQKNKGRWSKSQRPSMKTLFTNQCIIVRMI